MVDRRERLRLRPGVVAGAADAPVGDDVVDAAQRAVDVLDDPGREAPLDVVLDALQEAVDGRVVTVLGVSRSSAIPSSLLVATSASARSWLMCALSPAIANCSGAMPFAWRFSNSGAHAFGTGLAAAASSTAVK